MPEIYLQPHIAKQLMAYAHATELEFSGFGFCERKGDMLDVYDFVLLHVGSFGYTEIPTEKIVKLASRKDAKNMRVWIHRHPVGNGVPGAHNWSGTDERTCTEEPMGTPAAFATWAAAVVITPKGWVGRIDTFKDGKHHKTVHLPVTPATNKHYVELDALKAEIDAQKTKAAVARFKSGIQVPKGFTPDYGDYFDVPESYYDDIALEEEVLYDWIQQYGAQTRLGYVAKQLGFDFNMEKDDEPLAPQRSLYTGYNKR